MTLLHDEPSMVWSRQDHKVRILEYVYVQEMVIKGTVYTLQRVKEFMHIWCASLRAGGFQWVLESIEFEFTQALAGRARMFREV